MRIQPFGVALQVHLLRHFRQVPQDYLAELSRLSGQPPADLLQLMETAGSKFHPAFASDPQQLYLRVVQAKAENRFSVVAETAGKTDYMAQYDRQQWPGGIGYDQVIPLPAVKAGLQNHIRWQQRNEHLVQVLPVRSFPPTWQLNCITGPAGEATTIFPGTWLPPLNSKIIHEYVFLISDKSNSTPPDEQ